MKGPQYQLVFSNPVIEAGEYMARLVSVTTFPGGDGKHIYQVEVELDGNDKDEDGAKLSSILHPTPKGQKFIDALMESFEATPQTIQQAVGRYAAVYVYQSLYKGSAFSVVKFHPQPDSARQMAVGLEMAAREAIRKCKAANLDDLVH